MNRRLTQILAGLMLLWSISLIAATARIQVIHNAADPVAAEVDVYLDGTLLLDDFAFRTATPYIDFPAERPVNIGIAPGNSHSAADTLRNFVLNAREGQTFVAVANGIAVNGDLYAPNPNGVGIALRLILKGGMREAGLDPALVDLRVLHGATDAPKVDVIARGVATIVNDLQYKKFTDYIQVPPAAYTLDVTPADDNSTVVASFSADLNGLGGGAAIVFASGFLDPSANNNGPAFGLFAALPTGDVVELPAVGNEAFARIQVIHNAADPVAAEVDVYLDGALLLDDFAFRTATPYIDFPAERPVNIGIAPGNSHSAADTLRNFVLNAREGQTFVAVANGIAVNGDLYAPNPNGVGIALRLILKGGMREAGLDPALVDLRVLHGATDAPKVDVIARGVATIVNDLQYKKFTDYIQVPPAAYTLDVTPADDNSTVVASFSADLNGLGGGAAIVFASGFLDPSANNNGPAFGLFAALPTGDVVELPAVGNEAFARIQVIHNAADPVAAEVDVYLDGALLLDDFAFRTATPYIDFPAERPVNIGIAPGNSHSAADTLRNFVLNAREGQTFVAVANGIAVNGDLYAPNPNGVGIALRLILKGGMREAGLDPALVDLRVLHGATDAPKVDVIARGVATIVNDLQYKKFTDYIQVPPAAYTLDVTPADDNSTVVASFSADLNGLGGGAAIVFASGFLDPSANNNGPAFGLFAALPTGDVVELPAVGGPNTVNPTELNADNFQSVESLPERMALLQNYPNPFNPTTTLRYGLSSDVNVNIVIYNMLGQKVATLINQFQTAGFHTVVWDGRNDAGQRVGTGVYVYRLTAGDFVDSRKMLFSR